MSTVVADGILRLPHDRLHVAHRAEEVGAVDGRSTTEADDQVLREVRHADDLVRQHLPHRHDEVPLLGHQGFGDLDEDGQVEASAREGLHLLAVELAQGDDPIAPAVVADPFVRHPVAE